MKTIGISMGIALGSAGAALLLTGCPQRNASAQNSKSGGSAGTVQDASELAGGVELFEGVARLNLSADNGTVRILRADAAPGTVEINWRAQLADGSELSAQQLELMDIAAEQRGADLQFRCEYKGEERLNVPELHADLVLGPDIIPMLTLGNGTLEAVLAQSAEINLGNGQMTLAGQLSADSTVQLGNGSLAGSLKLDGGSCEINVGNGEVDLKLDQASSVKYSGVVGMGSVADAAPGQSAQAKSAGSGFGNFGQSFAGQLGQGAGQLSINVGMGSISID